MELSQIEVKYAEIVKGCPDNKSPIFYCNIHYGIIKNRKEYPHEAKEVVVKGTIEEIKNKEDVKRRVLHDYYRGASNSRKKVNQFNMDNIVINKVILIRSLGYGIK